MNFHTWLKNRNINEMKDSQYDLLLKYLPLVKKKLEDLGIDPQMNDSQLIGYLNHVAGFSIPADDAGIKWYANGLANRLIEVFVKEQVGDIVERLTRPDKDLAEILQLNMSVKIAEPSDIIPVKIRFNVRHVGLDMEQRFSAQEIIERKDKNLSDFIKEVISDYKTRFSNSAGHR